MGIYERGRKRIFFSFFHSPCCACKFLYSTEIFVVLHGAYLLCKYHSLQDTHEPHDCSLTCIVLPVLDTLILNNYLVWNYFVSQAGETYTEKRVIMLRCRLHILRKYKEQQSETGFLCRLWHKKTTPQRVGRLIILVAKCIG